MQELFDKAVNSTGQQYLDAEQALLSAGAPVTGVLQQNLQNPDPVASLIARVLLDWKQGRGEEFNRANEYLNGLPNRLARTPITAPPPVGVAGYLSQNFGPRVAEFLAVRLLKEGGWPGWRTAGVLLYLRQQAVPSTTAALIRIPPSGTCSISCPRGEATGTRATATWSATCHNRWQEDELCLNR